MVKKKQTNKATPVIVTAILALAVLEIFAMHYGINGTFRTLIFTVIAGLAGWTVPQLKIGGK